MNVSTSVNYGWWVAAGGAVGALVYYLAVTAIGPRVGASRLVLALTMFACLFLGIVVASGRNGEGYAFLGVGVLGSLAPFTAVAGQALTQRRPRSRHSIPLIALWIFLVGVSMAMLGYILADIGSKGIEKLPG